MINLSQEEVMKNWSEYKNDTPLVSICCITYNHIQFIEQCLDGFLMQKTTFPFEIIIHDDCSTDGTAEIIKDYVNRFPKLFKPFFEKENQYSKGVKGIYVNFVFPYVNGKYIAMCEGDDYWIDNEKLERQVSKLEKNTQISLSAENTKVLNSIKKSEYLFSSEMAETYSLQQLLRERRFATSSVVFRTDCITRYLKKLETSNDTIIWSCCATCGIVSYEPKISSVYRRGLQGVTENTDKLKWAFKIEEWTMQIYKLFAPDLIRYNEYDFNVFKSFAIALYFNVKQRKRNIIIILKKMIQYYKFGYCFRLIFKYGN